MASEAAVSSAAREIRVPLGERSYNVLVAPGALSTYCAEQWDEAAVLSNHAVMPLYGEALSQRRRERGLKTLVHVAPNGEAAKNIDETTRAWDTLAQGGLTRRGAVVAVGGGVVGDWAGFVAATWMRGVDFVQVPTTLLAMVDSSVGGKTGINHPRAKNLIGAFHQPRFVLADPQVLATLPQREVRAGLAEVIKYGVIADAEFFFWLEENLDGALNGDVDALSHIIARSVEIKAQVVGEDERESDSSGRRATLNYGHTLGHAIEATAAYGKYLHGEAIAIGMTVAARLALEMGTIARNEGQELIERQTRLFERAGLPTAVPSECSWDALVAAMALDKKSRGASLNFVLPTRLGHVEVFRDVPAPAVCAAAA
jgi:3-dehydroquinate synthase